MAITIENLRIIPYTQKNIIKPVFGDTMTLTFTLPEPYITGDEYILGLDYERVLIPTAREICALTDDYTIDGENITFNLLVSTARFRDWVSTIKKPMPIWLQIQRVRNEIYETILLDDVLALPSVIDGANTVCPGDPLADLLDKKLDKPIESGTAGNLLKLGENGQTIWGSNVVDVSWDDVTGKPNFANVATTGNYNDLVSKPTIPVVNDATITFVQGDSTKGTITLNQSANATITLDAGGTESITWDDITSKPDFAEVATTGDYNDLTDKPNLATVALTGAYNDLTGKPNLASVAITGSYDDLSNKPTIPVVNDATVTIIQGDASKGSFTLNQSGNTTITLDDGIDSVSWDDIKSKPEFANVAITGSYDDLTDKPTLATVASTGSYDDLNNKPRIGNTQIAIYQGGDRKGDFYLNQDNPLYTEINLDQGWGWQDIETPTATSSITLTASHTAVKQYAISASITLDAGTSPSYDVEYAEIVLDVAQGAIVTAGSNIVFADAITDGKRNVCVVRWYAGSATLYVVDRMDYGTSTRSLTMIDDGEDR